MFEAADDNTTEAKHARHRTWERRMQEARKKHRPKLLNWSRDGFCFQRKDDFENFRRQKLDMQDINTAAQLSCFKEMVHNKVTPFVPAKMVLVPRVNCRILNVNDFIESFEVPDIPCAISGIPQIESWKACQNWTFDKLKHQYKSSMFKVGEDDKGYKVKVRMKYLLKYLKHNKDDSPLYCFDSGFDCNSNTKSILQDYCVPQYFPFDLFSLVGEKKRPPYRWFLIGPKRSGTTLHVDPLGTSAWNTSLVGRKRWVLFPPHVPKSVAKGNDVIKKGEDDEAINYFVDILPRIRKAHPEINILEFVQGEGDTVFIPGGWWHAVINLDDTIAITQNYCSPANFDNVWRKTRKGRKKMSVRWLRLLSEHYRPLAERAEELNKDDGFVMYSSPKKEASSSSSTHSKKKKRESETNLSKLVDQNEHPAKKSKKSTMH